MNARAVPVLLVAVLGVAVVASFGGGAADLGPAEVLRALGAPLGISQADPAHVTIVWQLRAPRALLGILVGSTLAQSGAAMQGLFRNPLADPTLIGVASGAVLGAAIVIVLGEWVISLALGLPLRFLLPVFAFVGSALATWIVVAIGRVHGRSSASLMLLAGIAVNSLVFAVTGLLIYVSDHQELRDLTFWTLGSLGGASWSTLGWTAPPLIVVSLALPRLSRSLDLMLLGDGPAAHLGVSVARVQRIAVALVALGVGAAVSATGMIGFIGLVVPHLMRLAGGPAHLRLLPYSALAGAALLLWADLVARTVVVPAELPIGVVTAMIGAPFFLALLIRDRRRGELS